MDVTLFQLAGIASLGWLLLILLPTWRVTRRIADSWVFPAYVALLYLLGVGPAIAAHGLGIMRDFGSAEGVQRLLTSRDIALVAWVHILAFDQVVGHLIYRDNMRHRFVSLPVQSAILALTLMFGPIGAFTYGAIRWVRARQELSARNDRRSLAFLSSSLTIRAPMLAGAHSFIERLMNEHRPLIAIATIGLALGLVDLYAIAVHGRAVAPADDLMKAATFSIAVGLYTLTNVPLLAVSGFSSRAVRWWTRVNVVCTTYGLAIENLQVYRGVDPRFDLAIPNLVAGIVFYLTATTMMVLFLVLARRFFGSRHELTDRALVLGIRYGVVSVAGGFLVGQWMSFVLKGRHAGLAGNALVPHAFGFHGMQAVPVVALLLALANVPDARARRVVHAAGAAWLLATFGVIWQSAAGLAPGELSLMNGLVVAGVLGWASAAMWAGWAAALASREDRVELPIVDS